MNPVIKSTTLFGLLAVTLGSGARFGLAAIFFLISAAFVWRSFYDMRIPSK